MIEGKVGKHKIVFKGTPRGKTGEVEVEIDGKLETVQWNRDDQGIWVETSKGYFGFDARKTVDDEGNQKYELLQRRHASVLSGIAFLKAGEGAEASGAAKVKKGAKIKSQMPGKIVRVLIKAGDTVKRGQSLLVMEAMKMENEIKSPQDGTIKELKVAEGQAVETGAELLNFQ